MIFSIGYSALTSLSFISGSSRYNVKKDVRVANIELTGATNNGMEIYTSTYNYNSVSTGVNLSAIGDEVVYTITLTNYSNQDYTINYSVDNDNNEGIIGTITNVPTYIAADSSVDITLTYSKIEGSNNIDETTYIFTFGLYDMTPPVIDSITSNKSDFDTSFIMSINATDIGVGLHNSAYSFNNGTNYQQSNTKTISSAGNYDIKVRDLNSNVAFQKVNVGSRTEYGYQDVTEWNDTYSDTSMPADGFYRSKNQYKVDYKCTTTTTQSIGPCDWVGSAACGQGENCNGYGNCECKWNACGDGGCYWKCYKNVSSTSNATTSWQDSDSTVPDGCTKTGINSTRTLYDLPKTWGSIVGWELTPITETTSRKQVTRTTIKLIGNVESNSPIINSITSNQSDWNTSVTLTIGATDDSGLAANAYSFDNGVTWQSSSSKTFTNSGTINIKVKDIYDNIDSATATIVNRTLYGYYEVTAWNGTYNLLTAPSDGYYQSKIQYKLDYTCSSSSTESIGPCDWAGSNSCGEGQNCMGYGNCDCMWNACGEGGCYWKCYKTITTTTNHTSGWVDSAPSTPDGCTSNGIINRTVYDAPKTWSGLKGQRTSEAYTQAYNIKPWSQVQIKLDTINIS